MNKLYKKIYEAVNTGIQKALIIDPVQDVSVKWHNHSINNDFDYWKSRVSILLSSNDDKQSLAAYNELVNFYYDNNKAYAINNYKELTDILFRINQLYYLKHFRFSPFNMKLDYSWLDLETHNIVNITVINYKGNSNFQSNEKNYKEANTGYDFIKITCPELINGKADNSIIIHKNMSGCKMQLMTFMLHEPYPKENIHEFGYEKDYNGFKNTKILADTLKYLKPKRLSTISPTLAYLKECEKELNNQTEMPSVKAYIPAAGQMKIISELAPIINWILPNIGGNQLNEINYWTSTVINENEYSSGENTYYEITNIVQRIDQYQGCQNECYNQAEQNTILPLFKIKG